MISAEEIEKGLTSPNPNVRAWWAARKDWGPPAPEQVERGLNDRDELVRAAWVRRTDWGPPSEHQVTRGLSDPNSWVIVQWLDRMDYSITPDQAERIARDIDPVVCKAWANRLAKMAQEAQDELIGLDQPGP